MLIVSLIVKKLMNLTYIKICGLLIACSVSLCYLGSKRGVVKSLQCGELSGFDNLLSKFLYIDNYVVKL